MVAGTHDARVRTRFPYLRAGRIGLMVFASFQLAACVTSRPAEPDSAPRRLRVLTYNVRHCQGADGIVDTARVAGVVRGVSPDIVILQEIDCGTQRSGGTDQARELGRLTGLEPVFGAAIPHGGGEYGNAVLTRFPPAEHATHALPGDEPRVLLDVRCRTGAEGDGEVRIFATHFDNRNARARAEAAARVDSLATAGPAIPVLLAGDLNCTPGDPVIAGLEKNWRNVTAGEDRRTFPADAPAAQIDYIFLRPRHGWRVVETRVIDEGQASDHRPLLAVLELLSAASGSGPAAE